MFAITSYLPVQNLRTTSLLYLERLRMHHIINESLLNHSDALYSALKYKGLLLYRIPKNVAC